MPNLQHTPASSKTPVSTKTPNSKISSSRSRENRDKSSAKHKSQDLQENLVDEVELEIEKDAIRAILSRMKNCVKTKTFTDSSIENFSKKDKNSYATLERILGDINSTSSLIKRLSDYIFNCDDENLKEFLSSVLKKMVNKNYEIDKEVLNVWNIRDEQIDNNIETKPCLSKQSKEKDDVEESESESESESDDESSSDDEERLYSSDFSSVLKSCKNLKTKDLLFLNTMQQLADSIKHSKVLRIKTLSKSTQNVERWFEEYERHTFGWNERDRAIELSSYLDEEPLKVWETASDKTKSIYKEIKKRLIDHLNSKKWKREFRNQIYTTKQENHESINQFAQRLKSILKEWPEEDQKRIREVMKETFIYNCNPNISRALLGCENMPFKDLVKKARAIEEHDNHVSKYEIVDAISKEKQQHSDEESEVAAPIGRVDKVKCYKCNNIGHIAKSCTSKSSDNKKPIGYNSFRQRCLACGSNEHTFASCDQIKNLINSLVESKLTKQSDMTRPKWCSNCKMNNHTNKECRKLNKSSNNINSNYSNSNNSNTNSYNNSKNNNNNPNNKGIQNKKRSN